MLSKIVIFTFCFFLLFFSCDACCRRRRRYSSPTHGNWGAWSPHVDFNSCECRGTVTQRRYCNNPSPSHGGRNCPGSDYRDHDCNECHCDNGGCQHHCRNIHGSYECSCYDGYIKDGHNCIAIRCRTSDWPAPENGGKTDSTCNDGSDVSVGTTCRAKCKPGYRLDGSSLTRCNSNGNWVPSNPPICRAIICSSISVPAHGSVSPAECTASPIEGTVCTLKCENSYSLVQYSGSQYQTRCSDGRWTNPSHFFCRDLKKPVFTSCSEEEINVFADKGQIKATASWEPVKAKDNDGSVPQMTVYPSYISPSATSYEFPEESLFVTYTAKDTSGNTARCSFRVTVQVRRCTALSPPTNGRTIPQTCSDLYGSKCSFECNEGYNLTGSASRECVRKNGSDVVRWTGADASCQKIRCPTLVVPKYTTMTGIDCSTPNPSYRTYCTFNCKTGYQAKSGSIIRTCKSNGMWSGDELVCEMVTCPALAPLTEGLNVSNDSCISQKSSYQQECRYTCGKGYMLLGTTTQTCSSTGQWSPPRNPHCRDVSVPSFSSCPSNIRAFADRKSRSTRVNWTAPTASDNAPESPAISHHGQLPGELFSSGHHTIKYVATDKSGNSASCIFQVSVQVVACPELQTPLRGSMQCTHKNIFGSECQFSCNLGYALKGSQKRTCEKDASSLGYWTGNATYCEAIMCPNLGNPVNGFKSGCSRNTFGENCLFYCNIGSRVVNGSGRRTCLKNSTWSGTPLVCEGITCPALAAPANGRILPSECYNTAGYGLTCQFVCGNGYQLVGSNIRTCLANGQWNDQSNVSCKDIQRPRFNTPCPYNIDVFAEENKDAAQVAIPSMSATDNSGGLPTITVQGRKTNYTAGRHLITITASDASGNTAVCRFYIGVKILRCYSHPSYITNGKVVGICKNTYGSTCHFQCDDGYNITGSSSRTCKAYQGQIEGYWTGTMPFCSINRCPPLQTPANGYVYPPMCVYSNGPVIDTTCQFGCYNGYVQSAAGTQIITCGKSSSWSHNVSTIIKCSDKTPPVFIKSCPSDVRISLGHNGTATANWAIPVAEDNSHIAPTIKVHPSDAVPPYSINRSVAIQYTATDKAGNIGKCSFKITVKDDIGPRVVYCPPNQTVRATSTSQKVHWTSPTFVDNSNVKIVPQCNRQSGTTFYWGVWTIHCRGYDDNPENQPALCTFNITVEPTPCPSLIPPKNGAKACDTWAYGRYCTPHCNVNYEFAVVPPQWMWVCGSSGSWMPPMELPDCSKTYVAGAARKTGSLLYYFEGNCSDPVVQDQIKKSFIAILKGSSFKEICLDPKGKDQCNETNVDVVCGETSSRRRRSTWEDIALRRTRRSVSSNEFKVNFELSFSLESGGASNKTKFEIESILAKASTKMADIEKRLKESLKNGSLAMNISGQVASPVNNSLTVRPTSFVCNPGQIFLNKKCVACPIGTYHNSTLDQCIDCDKGWYQETEGQESCISCPVGMSTVASKSKNRTDCKAYCQKGYYSPTGLEPCVACDKGSYQSMVGQLKCHVCPNNHTTHSSGAPSLSNCSAPCKPGSYSPNGLEPCTKCDKRSYQPNSESTSCVRCSGTKTTLNEGSNSSSACQEINECDSNPCQHGSTCTDLILDFACHCPEGYTGKRCEQDFDDCATVPCQNNATCHDLFNNFTCTCAVGFTGPVCETDIDECSSSPCQNNATCHDLIGRYECFCQPGYEGDRCEREINECQPSNPCLNGGTCTDKLNAFSCQCVEGFTGTKCEENIDDCSQNLCANGATCNDQINNYTCTCLPGYTGFYCDQEIDECRSNPCKNNGTCYNTIGSFTCTCPVGYNGSACETDIDECQSNPCLNGATCRDAIGSFSCDCVQGYHGDSCEKDIDECAFQPCSNNASCTNTLGSFICHCENGFTGKTCDLDVDECSSNPCLNNGSCINEINAFSCQCQDGYTGDRCEVNSDECAGKPCKNNGTCQDGINNYQCICSLGFTGSDCEIRIDHCAANPCENNGKCINLLTEYKCNCSPGYTGTNCSIDINECMSKPCFNNGTCQDRVNGFRCSCLPGFSGVQCQENIDDCKNNPCRNNASCVDGVDSYQCACPEEFTGTFCEVEIKPCDSFPCYNGGTCNNKDKEYTCSCPSGFTGRDCEVNIDDCKPTNPCQNNGSCSDLVSNYTCTCAAGFYGRHCENIINHCINANCSEHGKCLNHPLGFKCNCSEGYYGPTCAHKVKPCISSPCINGATCTNTDKGYNCSCRAGYRGHKCEENIDECQGHTCLNNATCIDQVNGYMCLCWDGFNGTHCEHQLYSCKDQPCLNNGTCVNTFGGYKCKCAERYTGLRCEADRNPCKTNPCLNAGTCKEYNITSFNCTCVPGYGGQTCGVNINDCASSPCPLHSNCIDKVNGYECKCHQSHTGKHCETVIYDNFDLMFQDKSVTSSVELKDRKNVPDMESFTIAFWVKPDPRHKTGTMFTYVVPESQGELVEISFTAEVIQVQVRYDIIEHQNIILDGKWHLIGVSWSRSQNSFTLYVDGQDARALYLGSGPPLKGGGWIILGQKYSWSKKSYVASESFVGILHQVNIWRNAANQEYMWNAAHKCSWPIGGDVNSWIGFMFSIRGNVVRKFPTSCKALDLCMQNCTHYVDCIKTGDAMVCTCQTGFTGQLCDININDCESNPCVNGKCVDDIATYRCECQKGFFGERCEKKLKSTTKKCPTLPKLQNGEIEQRAYGGKHMATLKCNDNYGFKPEDVIKYSCGPETDWKWNRQDEVTLPRCLSTSEPIAIRHKYEMVIPLNPSSCRTPQQYERLKFGFKQAFMTSISTLDQRKCFALGNCKIENINAPRCGHEPRRQRRAFVESLEIKFDLMFAEWGNSSQHSTVTENAEAVAFQLSYAVSVGNFTMMVDGTPVKPRLSSLKLVSKSHQCKDGYVNSNDNASCVACPAGTHLHSNFKDCVSCPFGQYQDMEGKMTCIKCPEGYSTETEGATTKDQCHEQDTKTPFWKYLVAVLVLLIVIAIIVVVVKWKKRPKTKIDNHQYSTVRLRGQQENNGYDENGDSPNPYYNTLQRGLPCKAGPPVVKTSQGSQRYDESVLRHDHGQQFSTFLGSEHQTKGGGSQENQGYDERGDAMDTTNREPLYQEIPDKKMGQAQKYENSQPSQYEIMETGTGPQYENNNPLHRTTFGESKV